MGTIECSQPASQSSWDSQDFGDISMLLKWPIFASPPGHDELKAPPVDVNYIKHSERILTQPIVIHYLQLVNCQLINQSTSPLIDWSTNSSIHPSFNQ